MTWAPIWTRPALRDMKRLDPVLARRIRDAMIELADTGRGDVAKIKGASPPEWRLRVGDRRVFFRFRSDQREILVLRVRRRNGAY